MFEEFTNYEQTRDVLPTVLNSVILETGISTNSTILVGDLLSPQVSTKTIPSASPTPAASRKLRRAAARRASAAVVPVDRVCSGTSQKMRTTAH